MGFGASGVGSVPFGSSFVGVGPTPGPGPVPAPPSIGAISLFSKRAGETQMRIRPVNALVADRQGLVATVTVVSGGSLTDGDFFTLDDLEARPIRFEYDSDGSVVESRVLRAIVFDGTETATEIRDRTIAAINEAPFFSMTARAITANKLEIEHLLQGVDGKGTATEDVAALGWLLVLDDPDGKFLFCLGDDRLLPPAELYSINDVVRIEQLLTIPVGIRYLRIQSRFRQPAGMPVKEPLPIGTTVSRSERKQLTTIQGVNIGDGEFFVLDDGANPAVTFEFDKNGSVVPSAILRPVDITDDFTPEQVRDAIVEAVNDAPTLDILAAAVTTQPLVALEQIVAGTLTVIDGVGDPGFTVVTSILDIERLVTPTAFFTNAHHMRTAFFSGVGITPGSRKIFEIESATTAVLADTALLAPGGPITVSGHVKGAYWEIRVFFDNNQVFKYGPGKDGGKQRDLVLPDLSINVSKLPGVHAVTYELTLAEAP